MSPGYSRAEHRRQLIPNKGPALGGEERDDGERLAGVDHDRPPGDCDLKRPEHPDRKQGDSAMHRATYLTLDASRNVPKTVAGQDGATPDRLDIRPVPLYFEPQISGDAAAQDKAIAG